MRFGEHSSRKVPTSKLAVHGIARESHPVPRDYRFSHNVVVGLARRVRAGFLQQIVGSPLARRIEAENRSAAKEIMGFLLFDHLQDNRDASLWRAEGHQLARALVGRSKPLLLDERFAGVLKTESRNYRSSSATPVPASATLRLSYRA